MCALSFLSFKRHLTVYKQKKSTPKLKKIPPSTELKVTTELKIKIELKITSKARGLFLGQKKPEVGSLGLM